jgi:hypothetical protein
MRGRSLRSIAGEEGASLAQVRRDLAAGVPPDTPAPSTVTGQDGKQYAATKPKPLPPEPVIDPARLDTFAAIWATFTDEAA